MRYRKFYPTFLQLADKADMAGYNLFDGCHWFDGTLTYTDSEGNLVYYPDFDLDPSELYTIWYDLYGEMKVGSPLKHNGLYVAEGDWNALAAKLYLKAQLWLKLNEAKYLGLIKTWGFKYDPLCNYDLYEASNDGTKNTTTTQTDNIGKVTTTTDTDAPETQSLNYTSTFENEESPDSHFKDKSESKYLGTHRESGGIPISRTSTEVQQADSNTSTTTYGDNQEWVDGSGDPSPLIDNDVRLPGAHNINAHKLIRKGNIGVTSSQDMINQERELQRENIVKEFFEDFNSNIMLSVWF